jgi:hypothetical protein
MQTYSVRDLQSMLGISRAGHRKPGCIRVRGAEPRTPQRIRFPFQDAVLLRTAYSLREAKIPARQDPSLAPPTAHCAAR